MVALARILKILLVLALAGYAYVHWQNRQAGAPDRGVGFVALPPVEGLAPDVILVLAHERCSAEEARRADRLERDLIRSGLPVRRAQNVSFAMVPGDPAEDGVRRLLSGALPIVIARGRGKPNPALDEVIAEYRSRG